jgi:pimeloyl-ACP methyl ester carboxylesterase
VVLRSLRAKAVEASAYARQALLLPRDLEPVVPTDVQPGDDVVFFLHGFLATAGVTRPMRLFVGRHAGIHTACLTYPPGPGVEVFSQKLEDTLRSLPDEVAIHLVGHSMGGIVARHYAVTRGDARVRSTIALASPFGGVRGAGLLPFSRDLDPASAPLATSRRQPSHGDVPHLSVFAGADGLTMDRALHTPAGADVVVLENRGHNAILFDREAIRLVERRVLRHRWQRPHAGHGR